MHLIQRELYSYGEGRGICFVRTTAQFFLNKTTLEAYFDHLIGHPADTKRHTVDRPTYELLKLLRIDIISEAFKFEMLNESFRRVDAVGTLVMPLLQYIVLSAIFVALALMQRDSPSICLFAIPASLIN